MRMLSSLQVPLLFLVFSCSKSPDVDEVMPASGSYEDVNKEVEDERPPQNSGTRLDPSLVPVKGTVVFDGEIFAGEEMGYFGLLAFEGSSEPEQATQISAGLKTDAGSLGVKINVPPTAARLDGLEVALGPDLAGSTASLVKPDPAMIAASGRAKATQLAGGMLKVTLEDVQVAEVINGALHTLSAEITGQLRIDCYVRQPATTGGNSLTNDSGYPLRVRDAELSHPFCAALRPLVTQP